MPRNVIGVEALATLYIPAAEAVLLTGLLLRKLNRTLRFVYRLNQCVAEVLHVMVDVV